MERKAKRSSIEKRFVMSILWVGVIPMTLALLMGYFAAREGQQLSVLQNLSTAANKTVDGIRLAVRERERVIQRIAQMPEIIDYLHKYEAGEKPSSDEILTRFEKESAASNVLKSIYCLYDKEGNAVAVQKGSMAPVISNLEGLNQPRFLDLQYLRDQNRYAALLVTPVKDVEDNKILGYLAESQNIHELLAFMLDRETTESQFQYDRYEVVVFDKYSRSVVYLDEKSAIYPPPPKFDEINKSLEERLLENPELEKDSFTLWNYTSRGEKNVPVLMAYRRLRSNLPVYIAVHRPTAYVFRGINQAAAITLLVSMFIIGIFCAIGYRIVNNTIIRPVSLLNEGAQIIRQGDLELKLKIDTGDEIEELASSFNQMAAALRSNIRRLRSSEQKYRNLVTSMRDGIFQTGENNIITFINPSGVAILGYDQIDDVLGQSLHDLFIKEEEYEHVIGEISDQPFIESVRVWLKKKNGEKVCVDLSGIRLFGEWGELSGIDGSFRDVTRNVRLEKEVSDRAERMVAINQIVNIVNASIEAGRVYENLTREIRWLINFDYAAVSLRMDDGAFETRQLWPEPKEGREQFPRMDGENSCAGWVAKEKRCMLVPDLEETSAEIGRDFPIEVKSCLSVPLYAEQNIIGALNFGSRNADGFSENDAHMLEQMAPHLAAAIRNGKLLEDLTRTLDEVTQAREKLYEANEELKSLDEMKTNLLSNVSHELRTPLVAVMGYTDMVLNGKAGPVNDTQSEYLAITLRNVEKLVALIENLLDFSRLHKGKEELVFTRFDLVDCIHASMQTVKLVADGRKIAVNLNIHDGAGEELTPPIVVEGDKGKLGQVFNNLLANAVKFNGNGGSVTVNVEVRKDTVYIAVSDTGIGIAEEALDKVFTRFYQCDASSTRKYGGTGIGLAIAQDIIRLHGSRITVTSKLGEGSTFRFTLPLYMHDENEADGISDASDLPIETHLLIELVSRDKSSGAQIRNLLQTEGMDIIQTYYPGNALNLMQTYSPDCVLLDVDKDVSSIALLEDMKNVLGNDAIPVILITDDDDLYGKHKKEVAARVRRSFRKSTLLSGIQYALSQSVQDERQLGRRILCVDDDEEIGVFIARCLENEGYETDCCETGEEALELAKNGQYWLVLLDVAIPDMDGWEVCRRLKTDADIAGIKVYVVTAKAIEQQTQEMRESDADGYLLKPFKADDIVSVVRTFDTQQHSE